MAKCNISLKLSSGKIEGIDVHVDTGFGSVEDVRDAQRLAETTIQNIMKNIKQAEEGKRCVNCGGTIKGGKCEHCGTILQIV